MKFILGTKEEMTQIFDKEGRALPVTVINVPENVVTQVKTTDKDGYEAVQVSCGEKREKLINKPLKGHFKGLGNFRFTKEFRNDRDKFAEDLKEGSKIDLSIFEEGDEVAVSSVSKGKGFAGVVKRHGFHGGPRSHGQKHTERSPGSIGQTGIQRVMKGVKMGGRMGSDRVTIKNLKVVALDKEGSRIFLGGAIAGKRGDLVEIKNWS